MDTTHSYTRLTPDVEKDWVEDFVLEQRLIGVPGDRIGDALAVVQSHVAESGESAREAFGDPTAYAREHAASQRRQPEDTGWLLGIGLGLAGMLVTVAGANALWGGDGTVDVTVGVSVTTVVTIVVAGLVVVRPDPLLRLAVHRTWVLAAASAAWLVLAVLTTILLDASLVRLPAGAVTVAGAVLLGVGAALELRTYATGGLEDPVVGPGEEAPDSSGRAMNLLTVFLFPVLTLLLVGFGRVVDLLA